MHISGTIKYHSETPDIYSAEKIDFLGGAKLYDWTTKTQPVPDTQTGVWDEDTYILQMYISEWSIELNKYLLKMQW